MTSVDGNVAAMLRAVPGIFDATNLAAITFAGSKWTAMAVWTWREAPKVRQGEGI